MGKWLIRNKEDFIRESVKKHGNKYTYQHTVYTTQKDGIIVTCPLHGDFKTTVGRMLRIETPCPGCRKSNSYIDKRKNQGYTKEEFIKLSIEKHGDKYSYEKVPDLFYKESLVTITCPIHGDFTQRACCHVKGQGCPRCANNRRITAEIVQQKLLEVGHPEITFEENEIINGETPIKFTCPKHGSYLMKPCSLMQGSYCHQCKKNDKFINEVKSKFNYDYEYSHVEFKRLNKGVDIICPIHGMFHRKAIGVLNGDICPKCKKEKECLDNLNKVHALKIDGFDFSKSEYCDDKQTIISAICLKHGDFKANITELLKGFASCPECRKLNTLEDRKNDFIEKSKIIHKDKYDYSKVQYNGVTEKVEIICPIHGSFMQSPGCHLRGYGCQKCGDRREDTKFFIQRAKEVHGDRYDYSETEYINNYTHVKIKCENHGFFYKRPYEHYAGSGCPLCNISRLEQAVQNMLDKNNIVYNYQYKAKWLGLQSLDFYLPDYNIGIECQGEQHFQSVDIFGGEESFKENKERDILKLKKCNENNVKLLYYSDLKINFPYKVIQTLDDLLQEILK